VTAELYDYPDVYDALLPVGAHLPLYRDLARNQSGAVLELACGTGLLTVPIAQTGLDTVGLDRSRAMLSVARDRARAAGASVTFVEGDMRHFAFDRTFELIFVARNSLLHLHSTADLIAVMTAAGRHLGPRGVFAFDVFNPNVALLARPGGQRFPTMEAKSSRHGLLRVEDTMDYDAATQVNHGTWYISTPERQDAWIVPLALRSIFPQELPLLVSAAGLELISRAGDFSGTPFGTGSRFQVCLCRRPS
jgi:SAM-dependent methyltransferase